MHLWSVAPAIEIFELCKPTLNASNATTTRHELYNIPQSASHDLQVVSTKGIGSQPESFAIITADISVFLRGAAPAASISS